MSTSLAENIQVSLDIASPDAHAQTPPDLVQYYATALATCDTSQDLVNCLLDMFDTSSYAYIEKHKDELYLLGSLWINAIYTNVFCKDNAKFRFELMILPPLFRQLGWTYDYDERWQKMRQVFDVTEMDKNTPASEVLQSMVIGAFIDALFGTPADAMRKLASDFNAHRDREDYAELLLNAGTLFGQYGWFFGNTVQ